MLVVQLPQQVRKGSGEVSCTFTMSTQGLGSGLGTAYRMSTPGKDLYGGVMYIDSQKVTEGNSEVLIRASTYSPHERRMLEIASALIPSESKDSVNEFFHHLKVECGKGYKGEEFLESIEGFEMNVFCCSADAAGGVKVAWEESFPMREDGRNRYVQCEFHFRQSEKKFEAKLECGRQGLVEEHKKLVKAWLAAAKGEGKGKAEEKLKVRMCMMSMMFILYLLVTSLVKNEVVSVRQCQAMSSTRSMCCASHIDCSKFADFAGVVRRAPGWELEERSKGLVELLVREVSKVDKLQSTWECFGIVWCCRFVALKRIRI